MFSLSLITLSCNDESYAEKETSSINARASSSEVIKAKELFIDMMKSSDYLSFKNSLNVFVDKMNGNAILFSTKEEYIEWISQNIILTRFSSTEEFSIMIDDMLAKNSILESRNIELFVYLNNADQNQFLEIVQPSLGRLPSVISSNDCTNVCIIDCEFALNGNEYAYSLDYGTNNHSFATSYYWIRYKSICDSLSACMGNCLL